MNTIIETIIWILFWMSPIILFWVWARRREKSRRRALARARDRTRDHKMTRTRLMFSEKSKPVLLVLFFLSLLLAGSAYFIFLHSIFPGLVPGYGGGERFALNEANAFTFQLPWWAHSRLHLSLQTNDTIELYIDGDYVCDCSHYELVIEHGDEALILLRSDSPVKGRFTARQEIPLEHQLLAFVMISAGLVGLALSITRVRTRNL